MHSGAMVRPGEEGALLSLLVVKSLVAAVDKQDSSVQDSCRLPLVLVALALYHLKLSGKSRRLAGEKAQASSEC